MRLITGFLVGLFLLVVTGQAWAGESSLVFLVRHAEKTTEEAYGQLKDPRLTAAGKERAEVLARLLAPAGITAVHSTDYRRTRETAAPTAEALGLDVQLYDARMLESFANELKQSQGRHLVVGHSNTTPQLVRLLGGEPGEPIDEATEYDRLYILVQHPEGNVTTIRQSNGRPNEDAPDGAAEDGRQ